MRRASFIRTMAFALAATALPPLRHPDFGWKEDDVPRATSFGDLSDSIFDKLWDSWSSMEIRHYQEPIT